MIIKCFCYSYTAEYFLFLHIQVFLFDSWLSLSLSLTSYHHILGTIMMMMMMMNRRREKEKVSCSSSSSLPIWFWFGFSNIFITGMAAVFFPLNSEKKKFAPKYKANEYKKFFLSYFYYLTSDQNKVFPFLFDTCTHTCTNHFLFCTDRISSFKPIWPITRRKKIDKLNKNNNNYQMHSLLNICCWHFSGWIETKFQFVFFKSD